MGSITKIISTKIENFVISTIEKRLGFNLETTHISQSGDDSPPLVDDKNFIVGSDETGRFVTLGNLMISQGAEAGEKILYSRDSDGNLTSSIYLENDGTITLSNDNFNVTIDPSGKVVFNNGNNPAARKNDSIASTALDDPTFWTWLSGAATILAGLGLAVPIPTSLTGKITNGTSEVLLP